MNRLFLLILFVSSTILCFGQNELKTKEDSILHFEGEVKKLMDKLDYHEVKLTATDKQGDVICEVRKAYYVDNVYLDVEVNFLCENDSPTLKFNNMCFCLLAEKYLKISSYNHFLDSHDLVLEEGVKKNLILRFNIYKIFKGPKPRLIEYLKLTESQSGQEFIFRNIPIDYDEDK